ncbi:hypothetical protein [Aequorivita sp. Q41]|uniref:hypothetical protein n=1 Tax=Aequorivita sp. Q41 TaxID=3153300 RepID=UPI003242633B
MISSKKTLFSIAFFVCLIAFSQNRETAEFGEPSQADFALKEYSKDPEAAGVVLFESGKNYFALVENYVQLIKEVHVKIKVLDASKFDHATVTIPYYNPKGSGENVAKIIAITHNGLVKNYIKDSDIFETDENPYWSLKKFTFPNIKDGSILEYTYRIESGYYSNFGGWQFQGTLPKIYSEFHTELPGNYKYNRTLYGNLKLYLNEAKKTLACFSIEGFDVQAECEIATYAMKNVPAAKEEDFMLSSANYLAGMRYELIEYVDFNRSKHPFARSWKDIDAYYQYDKDLGRQLKYTSYFKDALPASLYAKPTDLEKAKAIYYYIQNQMAWNGKYRILSEVRVKEAFERKSGNSSEINLSLMNALEAAGMDPKILLISTRDYPMPTLQYPVMSNFIYALVFLQIGNEKYFLDATDKHTPFGVVPFRDLCLQGRVLDFKKGSYWEPITPIAKNMHYVNMQLVVDKAGYFSGKANEVATGYIAVNKRKENNNFTKEEIIKRKQSSNEIFEVSNLVIENEKDLEKPYKESYDISLHQQAVGDQLFVYPFLMQTFFSENPFKSNTRSYPIDFGFPIINNYLISIDTKDFYEIVNVPSNKLLKLPENDGELSVVYDVLGNKVNIRLSVKLNNPNFAPEAYKALQEFFTELVKIQSEEPIELKKI